MSDDRLRIPQDPEYFKAIGLAVVAFSRLEWDAVWCCEKLKKGYINTIKQKTSGEIAQNLKLHFSEIENEDLKQRTLQYSEDFSKIVKERNALFHAKPGSTPCGEQRLFRYGEVWTIERINEFSDRCTRASGLLNALLYNELRNE